ncbi:EscJ/YscJ/HrcJ family type III secretion inner membrane ring protein [Amylibacter sp. SFDW26]|uniref:type III secretion system inner membrane ring lipoprotein SctJ n=1 Tax=Amylibacter sp. SFDW26 TaxID=2652722 RepID=UPI0012619E7B|nr:type III secretion inner membrane ring lipoprotein SctJ [Amylibacter sp. SFDW26]KAB7613609.1 EscJ/YscJ/HrcJ family type III secretion inner membrane ring protein [Amylibacter sp. SFDW26]
MYLRSFGYSEFRCLDVIYAVRNYCLVAIARKDAAEMLLRLDKKPKLVKVMMLFVCLMISGCKEVLYSELTEVDANEMATILEASGISVSRKRDKKGIYAVWIEGKNVAVANTILRSQGLPRKKYKSMDQLFAAEGLVGSPFEERVRYIFALEEKLTENLVSIHGIKDARVTVSIPEKKRFSETEEVATASVTLHHEEDFVVQEAVSKIKTLVANAVQGLDYSNVAVVVFPAGGTTIAQVNTGGQLIAAANAAGVSGTETLDVIFNSSIENLLRAIFAFSVIALGLLFGMRFFFKRMGLRWSK